MFGGIKIPNGSLVPFPAGLAPAEHACLTWTHNVSVNSTADWIDAYLLALGIAPVIPSKANENRNSRTVTFDREAYRDRNIIERLIGWLKECRRIFSRFEKTAKNFGGMIKMAFIQRYLRLLA